MSRTTDLAHAGYVPVLGQCRFEYVSTSVTRLNRYNGRFLMINGKAEEIPSAGVDLANTALGANDTTYYVYAYMNSGTMTLEVSTTAYATDSVTGVVIKNGDATRTLVGMVRKTGGNFVYTADTKLVASWFNRRPLSLYKRATTVGLTTTPAALSQVAALVWSDHAVHYTAAGSVYSLATAVYSVFTVWVDGVSIGYNACIPNHSTSWAGAFAVNYAETPAEGYRTYGVAGACDAGTAQMHEAVSTATIFG